MTRSHSWFAGVVCIAGIAAPGVAQDPKPKADPAAIAKQILDDATPAERRSALVKEHAAIAPELITAMTADLKAGPEEYRRIPWIWRVAIAAGRRNDADQLRRLLDVSLPKSGEPLRDWQAVVIGGGLINGVSLEKKWPGERFNELLKGDDSLTKRWSAALADAHRMADAEKVPNGTRYDALRMIALDSWDKCGQRLAGYLKKGAHAELQMGAISGLSDIDRPEVAALLADGLAHFPAANRKLALDALLRTDARKTVLKARLDKGEIDRAWLDEKQREALEPKPPMLTPEEQKLAAEATAHSREGIQLYQQGRLAAALEKLRQALDIRTKIYTSAKYAYGHHELATSLNNMGVVLRSMDRTDVAIGYFRQSLEMKRKLYPTEMHPDGHSDIALGLNNLGAVLEVMGEVEKAQLTYQESLEMWQRLVPVSKYPDGHPHLAECLMNLGSTWKSMGHYDRALDYCEKSLAMRQRLFPKPKYPEGHIDLAKTLNVLGLVLHEMGQIEKALDYYNQSLEMRQRLYPVSTYSNGHPHLADSLHNVASALKSAGLTERALEYGQKCLAMRMRLYPLSEFPDGHDSLALSHNSLGAILIAKGNGEEALTHYQRSLDIRSRQYPPERHPNGHTNLARSLNNMGFVFDATGEPEKALRYVQQGLAMRQKLFPASKYADGHFDFATSLDNVGVVLQAMGQAENALPFVVQGLDMRQRLLRRELATATEEAAFDRIDGEPLNRDSYLTVTRSLKTSGGVSFAVIWPLRSIVTRLLEQRQASARAAGTELGDDVNKLRGLRRRVDHLLQDTKIMPDDRDKLLATVAQDRDKLERELVARMPTLQRWQELDKLGPADLAKALPSGAVFVDVIRFTHFEYVDKKQKRTPSYVAFVVGGSLANASGLYVARVELDAAEPIDTAVRQWRDAIEARRDEPKVVAELQRLVWDKLAPAIPAGTTTLYLATDGDLARLPWAALPIGNDQILLEKYAVAQVPHGTFLLDQLRNSPHGRGKLADRSILTLGGVDYGASPWPALPGTAVEARAIAAIAPGERYAASGAEATADKLKALLPRARLLHLATHGEFKETAFAQEQERARKARELAHLSDGPRGIGAKNPLGYVGVVLAGGEVLSGLQIVDLHLENVHLVTLSACETGLGALTGGEGVQGLQRAFHLAGCPNVVASLWKVNDAATAALMAKFYHEMWVNKKPPIEALREAQLFIYYNPDKIPDVLGERGAPKRSAALEVKNPAKPQAATKRADTKLWAAFVLSGVGK